MSKFCPECGKVMYAEEMTIGRFTAYQCENCDLLFIDPADGGELIELED